MGMPKMEDLGIDPDTRVHNPRLTRLESRFIGILWDHHGPQNRISAADLAARLFVLEELDPSLDDETFAAIRPDIDHEILEDWKRKVRGLQNHLLFEHRVKVLSKAGAGGGYWMADSKAEAEEFYATFRRRALTGMVKASRGNQDEMADMMTQLSLEFGDISDASGMAPPARPDGQRPLPAMMVDRLLERMLASPGRFEADLRRISEKFGRVLFSREQANEVKQMAARLNELAAAI